MTIYNLASINLDHVYRLPHLPKAGETLAGTDFSTHLGGKGANQALAIARAGGKVRMGGMLHKSDAGWLAPLTEAGVDIAGVVLGDTPTGHAIIALDEAGENQIILAPLSNHAITDAMVADLLQPAKPRDWALTQNETNMTAAFIRTAKQRGLRVCYSAAPFVAEITADMLDMVDVLVVNEGEAAALAQHMGKSPAEIVKTAMAKPAPHLLITRGKQGADCHMADGGQQHCPALPVDKVVDTTGAGDTYLGYVLAGLDNGVTIGEAMQLAAAAAALQISRLGAAEAIPNATETKKFLASASKAGDSP